MDNLLIQLPGAALALLTLVFAGISTYFLKRVVDRTAELSHQMIEKNVISKNILEKIEALAKDSKERFDKIDEHLNELPNVKQDVAILKFVVFNKSKKKNGHPKMDDSVLDDSE